MAKVIGIVILVVIVSALMVRFIGAFIAFGMGDGNE